MTPIFILVTQKIELKLLINLFFHYLSLNNSGHQYLCSHRRKSLLLFLRKHTSETISYHSKCLHLLPFKTFGVGNKVFVGSMKRYHAYRSAACKKSQQSQIGVPVFVTMKSYVPFTQLSCIISIMCRSRCDSNLRNNISFSAFLTAI